MANGERNKGVKHVQLSERNPQTSHILKIKNQFALLSEATEEKKNNSFLGVSLQEFNVFPGG